MEQHKELGDAIRAARLAAGLSVVQAAKRAGVARDTWKRIETGESVQDTKRQRAIDLLGLDSGTSTPVSAADIDARLANMDRQIHMLWEHVERLEERDKPTETKRPNLTVAKQPSPPVEDLAADDPGTPSVGELTRAQQDDAYPIDQDPEQP